MHGFIPYLLIFCGGGTGALARYITASSISRMLGAGFPWGTLAVNLIGAFCIGLLTGLGANKLTIGEPLKLLLVTGFLGGFTTFSAFSLETALFWQRGDIGLAALYSAASVILTVVLVFAGLLLSR